MYHIRNYCSTNITKRLVNALVIYIYIYIYILYYCFSLLYGIKNTEAKKCDQNIRSSVRVIHWLK